MQQIGNEVDSGVVIISRLIGIVPMMVFQVWSRVPRITRTPRRRAVWFWLFENTRFGAMRLFVLVQFPIWCDAVLIFIISWFHAIRWLIIQLCVGSCLVPLNPKPYNLTPLHHPLGHDGLGLGKSVWRPSSLKTQTEVGLHSGNVDP